MISGRGASGWDYGRQAVLALEKIETARSYAADLYNKNDATDRVFGRAVCSWVRSLCSFVSVADVAKGGDGAKSALW